MDKLEWLQNYIIDKLEEYAMVEPETELSISERAFLRANAIMLKYDKRLASLYSNEYVEISNSKLEKFLEVNLKKKGERAGDRTLLLDYRNQIILTPVLPLDHSLLNKKNKLINQ